MSKILIVDDSASIRQMLSFTLRQSKYDVVEAKDGKDALGKIDPSVKMVISDLNMPIMDGIELIRSLRAQKEYRFIPILMLTTEGALDKKVKGKLSGASGWIVKPFEPNKLIEIVRKFVRV